MNAHVALHKDTARLTNLYWFVYFQYRLQYHPVEGRIQREDREDIKAPPVPSP